VGWGRRYEHQRDEHAWGESGGLSGWNGEMTYFCEQLKGTESRKQYEMQCRVLAEWIENVKGGEHDIEEQDNQREDEEGQSRRKAKTIERGNDCNENERF